jgi:hypothetical protein
MNSMRRRRTGYSSLLSGFLVALLGCADNAHGVRPFEGATRIVIVSLRHDTLAVITDSTQVKRLSQFVNARLDSWKVDWAGVPIGAAHAQFWNGSEIIGTFGVGGGYFERQPAGDKPFAARTATQVELDEFASMTSPKLKGLLAK